MTEKEIKELAKQIVLEQMRYEVIGIDDVARILGVSIQTVYNRIDEIPHSKSGKVLRFFKGDIIKLLMR